MKSEGSKYMPQKIAENEIPCPACRSPIKLEIYKYQTPVEGDVVILVAICPHCGYRYREVVPSTHRERGVEIVIKLISEEALKILLYRSPYAYISIPELSIEIAPGPANPGEITTIEGLLLHIAECLYPLCDSMEDPAKCYDAVSKVVNAANGLEKITIHIKDPSGLSMVIKGYENLYEVKKPRKTSEAALPFKVVTSPSTRS